MFHTLYNNIKGIAVTLGLMSTMPSTANAQAIYDMFVSMPDTMMPYLPTDVRKTLVNTVRTLPVDSAQGNTAFDTDAKLKAVSPRHLLVSMDSTATVEMLMLPAQTDSVCCLIRTSHLPKHDSEVIIYDTKWNPIRTVDFKDFTVKPDTMSQERYEELQKKISFLAVEAQAISDTELRLIPSAPLIFKDDEEPVKSILLQRNVKWNKETFK